MSENENELILFAEGITLVADEFYVDAIHKFNEFVKKYPENKIADDALYNIARSYFELNQFNIALEKIKELETKYPDAEIKPSENNEEKGKILAKAKYLQLNCLLGLNRVNDAESITKELEPFDDSYVIIDGKKMTFKKLAKTAIDKYKSLK
jgi:tetratricopeptide (TPR) repeat protein